MTKKVVPSIIIAALICMFLDNVVFTRLNIAGIRPDMLMTLTVTLGILIGSTRAQLICGGIGLLYDILLGKFLGLNCAVYVVSGIVAGVFFRKFYTDNVIFPAVVTLILAFVRENVFAVTVALTGVKFNYALMLFAYIIPCAAATALMCIPMYAVMKSFLYQYGKYLSDKRTGLL